MNILQPSYEPLTNVLWASYKLFVVIIFFGGGTLSLNWSRLLKLDFCK